MSINVTYTATVQFQLQFSPERVVARIKHEAIVHSVICDVAYH